MKKNKALTVIHLSLIIVTLAVFLVSMFMFFLRRSWEGVEGSETAQRVIIWVIYVLALVGAFVYVVKGYAKNANFYYNAFFCMQIVATVLTLVLYTTMLIGTVVNIFALIAMGLKTVRRSSDLTHSE